MSDPQPVTDSTRAEVPAAVTPLWTDVVLDDAAIAAQRLALLAELASERFETGLRTGGRTSAIELAAARHLARGAQLARAAAEQERSRCASRGGRFPNDVGVS